MIMKNVGQMKELGVIIKDIPIGLIDENKGQIEGVPRNPRRITAERFKSLCESIEQSPEMKEIDEVLVMPCDGRYVAIGGNHRLRAYKHLKWELVRCKVLPEDTPKEKLREYVIKDNQQYATNDDKLLAAWDVKELVQWDVPMKLAGGKNGGDDVGDVEFTQILDEAHNYIVLYFDSEVDWLQAQTLFGIKQVKLLSTANGRDNKNGFKYGIGRVMRGSEAINRLLDMKYGGKRDEDIG